MKKIIKRLFAVLISSWLILGVSESYLASAKTECDLKNTMDYCEPGTLINVETNDYYDVHTYLEEVSENTRTSQKTVNLYYSVIIDNVKSYTIMHTITFTYAIPTSDGEKAQITTSSSQIVYTNSSSAYYPDTSTIWNSRVLFGNPASHTSHVDIYKKSDNSYYTSMGKVSYVYGNGTSQ